MSKKAFRHGVYIYLLIAVLFGLYMQPWSSSWTTSSKLTPWLLVLFWPYGLYYEGSK